MMFAVSCLGVMVAAGTAIAGGGNSGAVKTCQQGGYLNMQRSDGSSFKNVGDCVSYFAQGGTAGAACTVVPGVSGCLTFTNVVVPAGDTSGETITLNGSFSFNTTACDTFCASPPNGYATGGGTYTIDDSSGNLVESGTLVADNTTDTFEGLYLTSFIDADGAPASCSAAFTREVAVSASTGNPKDPDLLVDGFTEGGATPSYESAGADADGLLFGSDVPSGVTINC